MDSNVINRTIDRFVCIQKWLIEENNYLEIKKSDINFGESCLDVYLVDASINKILLGSLFYKDQGDIFEIGLCRKKSTVVFDVLENYNEFESQTHSPYLQSDFVKRCKYLSYYLLEQHLRMAFPEKFKESEIRPIDFIGSCRNVSINFEIPAFEIEKSNPYVFPTEDSLRNFLKMNTINHFQISVS